ncbi:MAG: DUF2141 domain-containing protein [Paludibacter sp.]|nr:DUF2141 domain-containing protein [Paludibacter sp.]
MHFKYSIRGEGGLSVARYLLCLVAGFVYCSWVSSQTLEVCVKNIRNNKGQLCVALFKCEDDFNKEVPLWENKYCKSTINEKWYKIIIPVMPGKYGVSVLDDENMDGKMNYNLIGLPLEGFGLSNYVHKGIRKPKFKYFSFEFVSGQKMVVEVQMVYF